MGLKKGFNYPDQHLACPECGKTFRNQQALTQHERMHLAGVKLAAPVAVGTSSGSSPPQQPTEQLDAKSNIQRLEEEVRTLKLEQEKRRLEASTVSDVKPDIMSTAGAGEISGQAKEIAQMRILGLTQQPQPESWFSKFLAQPGGIETMAKALKGILGVESHSTGDLEVLERLGINLRDLLKPQTPVTPPGTLKIGNLDLTGQALSPELLIAILNHESRLEAAKAEAESKNAMAGSLERLVTEFSPLIAKKLGGFVGGGVSSRPNNRQSEGQLATEPPASRWFTCSKCSTEIEIPPGWPTGAKIICPACSEEYLPQPADTGSQKKRVQVPVAEEKTTVRCPCGQILDVSGRDLLSRVKCPVCLKEVQISDPSEPLTPLEAGKEKTLGFEERNYGLRLG